MLRIQPALLFLTSAHRDEKFHLLKILFFSLLSQNFKSLPRKTMEIWPFKISAFSFGLFIHHLLLLLLYHKTKCLRSISPKQCDIKIGTCVKMFDSMSPVHCHYDKMSKGIISAIENLEKPLILPKFAHLISVIIACLGILLGIILFIL